MVIHTLTWRRRQLGYRQGSSLLHEARGGWFPLEKRLFLGLPESINWDPRDRSWLFHELWDYLVFLQSLTRAPGYPDSAFYVNPDNATLHAGVNARGTGRWTRADRTARIESLLPGLESLGFIKRLGEYRRDSWPKAHPVFQHMLMPTHTPCGLVPSGIPRTPANLEAYGRPYAMIPRHVMRAENGIFVRLRRHELRRLLLALYVFNDLPRFGGVDPNHLRVEEDGESRLIVSDEFIASAGSTAEEIGSLLNEVVGRNDQRMAVVSLPEVFVTSEIPSDGERRYRLLADVASYGELEARTMESLPLPHLRPTRIRVFRPVHQVPYLVQEFISRRQGRINGFTQ